MGVKQLKTSYFQIAGNTGQIFLWLIPAQWLEQPLKPAESIDSDPEVNVNPQQTSLLSVTHKPHLFESLICQFSSWQKLLRVYAWVVYFKNLFLRTLAKKHGCIAYKKASLNHSGLLTMTEISHAETELIGFVEQRHYSEEIRSLLANERLKRSSTLVKLNPILSESLLRLGGRLKHADLPLIRDVHVKLAHAEHQHVQAKLPEKYWIIKSNSSILKLLSSCVQCKRLSGKPTKQKMADLP